MGAIVEIVRGEFFPYSREDRECVHAVFSI